MSVDTLISSIILLPFLGFFISGIYAYCPLNKFGKYFGCNLNIFLTFLSFILSLYLIKLVFYENEVFVVSYFSWCIFSDFNIQLSFIADKLSLFMVCIITFISVLVQIYSVSYMSEEKNVSRFFSYISGFTY